MGVLRSQVVNSLRDFVDWTESLSKYSKLHLFRGQPVEGNLLPSIARSNPEYDTTQLERTILDQFKLMGASMLTGVGQGTLELMVVAQHYGLATRLLDWTINPLVALYFACADASQGDTFVYALSADTLVATDLYGTDPFLAPRMRIFQPPLNNPRVTAQQGWFTLHRYSDENQKFVALENNKDTKEVLSEARVPVRARNELRLSLSRHGLGSHALFPDLEGLAKHLNWTHLMSRNTTGARR